MNAMKQIGVLICLSALIILNFSCSKPINQKEKLSDSVKIGRYLAANIDAESTNSISNRYSWQHHFTIDSIDVPDSMYNIDFKYTSAFDYYEVYIQNVWRGFFIQRYGEIRKCGAISYYFHESSTFTWNGNVYMKLKGINGQAKVWYISWRNDKIIQPDQRCPYTYTDSNRIKKIDISQYTSKTSIGIWTDTVYTNLPLSVIQKYFPTFRGVYINKTFKLIVLDGYEEDDGNFLEQKFARLFNFKFSEDGNIEPNSSRIYAYKKAKIVYK
jgi:hypothetical protein